MKRTRVTRVEAIARQIAAHRGEVVLEDVDHGYKCQFWLVPMSPTELEQWWCSMETFQRPPNKYDNLLCQLFNEPPLPPRPKLKIPGTRISASSKAAVDLWEALYATRQHYSCLICGDEESYLKRPDGTFLYHRGFVGRPYPATNLATSNGSSEEMTRTE